MKKLNKSELEALGRKVRGKINDLVAIEQERLDKENEVEQAAAVGLISAELHKLSAETKKYLQSRSAYNRSEVFDLDSIRGHLYVPQTKYVVPDRYGSSLVDSLLLAQLETDSVQALIDSVTASFIRGK